MLGKTFYEINNKKTSKQILFLIIGIILYSIYAGIMIPSNNLTTGGALGIALVLNKLIGIKIGTAQFLLNIPLFYIGYKHIGKRFMIFTFIVIGVSSLLINYLPFIINPVNLHDKLVATIFSGILSGIALSFILMAGGSSGGSDITGKYFVKKFNLNIANVFLVQDIIIYIIVWIAFDIRYVMYALIMSFVRNQTIQGIQRLLSAYIQVTIIADNTEQLVDVINKELHRGCTLVDVEGGYTHQKHKMIILVIQQNEMYKLKQIIREYCPKVFITINSINTIMGNFKEHSYRM